jgi:hypothetical protein
MALTTATISGSFVRPDAGAAAMTAYIEAASENSLLTSAGQVIWSKVPVKIQSDGSATVTLWQLPQADIAPSDARWRLVMMSGQKRYTQEFTLSGDITWDTLVDVSGVPITSSLLSQAWAAAAQAQAAAALVSGLSPVSWTGITSVMNPTYGVDNTGATDTTTAVHAARDAAGAGGTLVFPKGTYLVNHLLANLNNQTWVVMAGATLKATVSQTLIEVTATGVKIVGDGVSSTVDGNNVGTTAGTTVYSHAASNKVEGLSFINCAGHGAKMQADFAVVEKNLFTDCGTSGVQAANVSGSNLTAPVIRHNRVVVASNTSYGIMIHVNSTGTIFRPRVHDNDLVMPATGTSGLGIEFQGDIRFGTCHDNTVDGSIIGISIDTAQSTAVTGNTVHGAWNIGIEMASAVRTACVGNTVDGNALTQNGITESNTAGGHNTIVGNTIDNLLPSGGSGIFGQNNAATGSIIADNNITAGWPIKLYATSGHTVHDNQLTLDPAATAHSTSGIELQSATNTTVHHNTVTNFTNCVNVFNGTMNGLIIGPNICDGTTTVDMTGGWTPGTNGVNSKLIRGNTAVGGLGTPVVGASPWTFTNTSVFGRFLSIKGGTVSSITKGGFTIATTTNQIVWVNPGESVIVTYSVAPTATSDLQ